MDDDLENIKIQLKDFLKGASSLVILGIGNDMEVLSLRTSHQKSNHMIHPISFS